MSHFPLYTIIPFIGMLSTIGVLSFITTARPQSHLAHFWEKNRNKLYVAIVWSLPILIYLFVTKHTTPLVHSLEEYFSFFTLLFALYTVSGGIYVDGNLRATPFVNCGFLLIGAVLCNIVGTTGASVLLIRPLLRTNSERKYNAHIIVFFIFIVCNSAGCLLPISDPPLFLGYLRGVPFFWTLKLLPEFLTVVGILITIFFVIETYYFSKERPRDLSRDISTQTPIRIKGGINSLWLVGILLSVIFITPKTLEEYGLSTGILKFSREYIMIAMSLLSLRTAPLKGQLRKQNNFNFNAIVEVGFIFLGIFITMIPALELLKSDGSKLGITEAWQFFWVTGCLSSVLDNAPTYLTFFTLGEGLTPETGINEILLKAVSVGAVFMGALTYIGNAPNFMIKSIADQAGYKTPDFFSYTLKYAIPILIPVFAVITYLFFWD